MEKQQIEVTNNSIRIGALVALKDIAENTDIRALIPSLAEAASATDRSGETIAENICRETGCLYGGHSQEEGEKPKCLHHGGKTCFAIRGDNRDNSVYGGMKCGHTPCTVACPAGIDIAGFMTQLRLGNPNGAAQLIMRVNPMPSFTGRLCEHACEEHCNQKLYDTPVSIRNIECAVGDYALDHKKFFFKTPFEENGKKVAIIGSGPAGLSAAYYLRGEGTAVTIYDTANEPGGMLMYDVTEDVLPKEIVRKYIGALEDMGICFVCNAEVDTDESRAYFKENFDRVYKAFESPSVIECVTEGYKAATEINKNLGISLSHACFGMMELTDYLTNHAESVASKSFYGAQGAAADTAASIETAMKEAGRCMNCGCYAAQSSDLAPVLVMHQAIIHTTKKDIKAQDFFCNRLNVKDILEKDETVTDLVIPIFKGAVEHYTLRSSDGASASLASAFAAEEGRLTAAKLVLGKCAPIPEELSMVSGFLVGKKPDEALAEQVANMAVKDCNLLSGSPTKIEEIKGLIRDAVLSMKS